MKNPKGVILMAVIIAAPIVWLCINLNAINSAYNNSGDQYRETEEKINDVINEEINNAINEQTNKDNEVENSSGESQSSIYGNPISKLVEGAKISVDTANIYTDPDESSAIVAAIKKDTIVTVQDYGNGWSNVKTGDFTGWIRTEFVLKPDDENNSAALTTAVGHKGIVAVETLNVRDQANSTGTNVVDQLSQGDEVNIIGSNEDESWYQIQYGTKSGWVSSKYVTVKY